MKKFIAPSACLAWATACFAVFSAFAAPASGVAAFSASAGDAPPPPWRVVGLPKNKAPLSRMDITLLDGSRVLRLASDASYGTLVHALEPAVPGGGALLRWRWQLAEPLARADLRRKEGDDVALKVCAMFDMPLGGLPFGERALMRLARAASGEPLPAATLCYVWDTTLPTGTLLPNSYTARVRFLVVNGADTPLGSWQTHQRNLHVDFKLAFGSESASVPPLTAIVVGADADNTGGRSLGYVGDVVLSP